MFVNHLINIGLFIMMLNHAKNNFTNLKTFNMKLLLKLF